MNPRTEPRVRVTSKTRDALLRVPGIATRGFTLIEVLVALVIAATALALGFGAISGSARRLARIEEAALTHWAIDNVVNDITLRAQTIEAGRHQFIETMLGRTLLLTAEVARDEKLPVMSIDVEVTAAESPNTLLDSERVALVVDTGVGELAVQDESDE